MGPLDLCSHTRLRKKSNLCLKQAYKRATGFTGFNAIMYVREACLRFDVSGFTEKRATKGSTKHNHNPANVTERKKREVSHTCLSVHLSLSSSQQGKVKDTCIFMKEPGTGSMAFNCFLLVGGGTCQCLLIYLSRGHSQSTAERPLPD